MITIQEGDMALLTQIKELDDALAEIPDFHVRFLSEIEDYNIKIGEIDNNIQLLQDQIEKINTEVQEWKQQIVAYNNTILLLRSQLKGVENVNKIDKLSTDIDVNHYKVIFTEKELAQKNDIIKKKTKEIEDLNNQKKNIEQAFGQIRNILESNNEHDKNNIEELKKKKVELINKLSNDVKEAYNKIVNYKEPIKPLAILRNGICSNCNLLNITKQQLDILLQKQLVTCEYCSSILVGVVNDNKTSRGNRKKHDIKDNDSINDDNDGIDNDNDGIDNEYQE